MLSHVHVDHLYTLLKEIFKFVAHLKGNLLFQLLSYRSSLHTGVSVLYQI
jgi:hypothetical protein